MVRIKKLGKKLEGTGSMLFVGLVMFFITIVCWRTVENSTTAPIQLSALVSGIVGIFTRASIKADKPGEESEERRLYILATIMSTLFIVVTVLLLKPFSFELFMGLIWYELIKVVILLFAGGVLILFVQIIAVIIITVIMYRLYEG